MSSNIFLNMQQQKGSHSIANYRALELLCIMTRLDEQKYPILEIGAGIGTITSTLLALTKNTIFAQEFDEECRKRLKSIKRSYPDRLKIGPNIDIQPYKFIIIDGPYHKEEMFEAIKVGKAKLKWVAIENGRTATRIQIANSLYKAGLRQSVVEFRRENYKPSLTFFFCDSPPQSLPVQTFADYCVVLLKYWPKYLKLLLKKGGHKHFRVGKKLEGEFGKK